MADSPLPSTPDGVIRWFFTGTICFALGFEGITMLLEGKFLLSLASLAIAAAILAVMVYLPSLPGVVLAALLGLPLIFLGAVELCRKHKFRPKMLTLTGIGLVLGALFVAAIGAALIYVGVTQDRPVTKPDSETTTQAPGARLVVTGFRLLPIDPGDPNSNYNVAVFFKNEGKIVGNEPALTSGTLLSTKPVLTPEELQIAVEKVIGLARTNAMSIAVEVSPGEELAKLDAVEIKKAEWDQVVAGKTTLFVFFGIKYTDATTRGNEHWISTFVGSQDGRKSPLKIYWRRIDLYEIDDTKQ